MIVCARAEGVIDTFDIEPSGAGAVTRTGDVRSIFKTRLRRDELLPRNFAQLGARRQERLRASVSEGPMVSTHPSSPKTG